MSLIVAKVHSTESSLFGGLHFSRPCGQGEHVVISCERKIRDCLHGVSEESVVTKSIRGLGLVDLVTLHPAITIWPDFALVAPIICCAVLSCFCFTGATGQVGKGVSKQDRITRQEGGFLLVSHSISILASSHVTRLRFAVSPRTGLLGGCPSSKRKRRFMYYVCLAWSVDGWLPRWLSAGKRSSIYSTQLGQLDDYENTRERPV